jgi:hypothetical protein
MLRLCLKQRVITNRLSLDRQTYGLFKPNSEISQSFHVFVYNIHIQGNLTGHTSDPATQGVLAHVQDPGAPVTLQPQRRRN